MEFTVRAGVHNHVPIVLQDTNGVRRDARALNLRFEIGDLLVLTPGPGLDDPLNRSVTFDPATINLLGSEPQAFQLIEIVAGERIFLGGGYLRVEGDC